MRLPERNLRPPEPVLAGHCQACGEAICVGDEVWRSKEDNSMICLEHMDIHAAERFGLWRSLAE